MKSLALFRHAKTERDSATGRDFDRALTDRGRSDAERVGAEIQRLGLHCDLVLASPARRSVETVEHAGIPSPSFNERIYDAPAGQLLELVRNVDDGVERLMMVGHNPGFERLASRLAGNDIEMPTGSLIVIDLPIERWADADQESGRLVRFITPRELA